MWERFVILLPLEADVMNTDKHTVYIRNMGYPGLNPTHLGWRNCPTNHQNGPYVRPYWLLYYVVSGSGTLYLEDKSYCVKAGSLFAQPPYVQATHRADEKPSFPKTINYLLLP